MTVLLQDLRYAWRLLAKKPGFTALAILTLALGIGANIAVYSVVHAILLNPLPFPHPEQLVRVYDDLRGSNARDVSMSVPEMYDLEKRSGVFQELSGIVPADADLAGADHPERVELLGTTAGYFTILGAKPQFGSIYTPAEAQLGFTGQVVISDGLWQREYGADPHVIGKQLRLDNDLYTIIGVMPPDFRHPGPTLQSDVDVWASCGMAANPFPDPPQRSTRIIPGAIARLRPGITLTRAQAQLDAFVAHLRQEYPNDYPAAEAWSVRLVPIQEDLVGNVRTELVVLFGAVAFVLLIGCVNLATFLLAKSASRQREMAIRLALGAGRGRLARQLLTESILLAAIAGLLALLTVVWVKDSLLALAPASLPRLNEVSLSGGVLVFAFLLSLLTGVLFGLLPALQAVHSSQVDALREGSRGSGSSARQTRLSRILVASEIALSLILLIGAGLLVRSFQHVLAMKPGFDPHNLVTAQIWLPVPNDPKTDPYVTIEKRAAFNREVLRRLATLPGAESVSVDAWSSQPMSSRQHNQNRLTLEGLVAESDRAPIAEFASVDPAFFPIMRMPLLAGRLFADADDDKSQPVAIIDEALAHRYWPGQDPLGKRIKPVGVQSTALWMTIVGEVGNIKSDGLDSSAAPHVYVPNYQRPSYAMSVYIRTKSAPASLADAIRQTVQSIDPNVPVFAVRAMDDIVARSTAQRRFAMQIVGVFAVVALLLAAIGIYGVMAYSVSQRTHEIGIRMALGAQPGDVLSMTLGEGGRLVALGLGSGLLGAVILTRFLRSLLFNVAPTDAVTFASVSALLAVVALLACYVPALRATRVDPLVALRDE
jgi:predicted permease